MKLLIRDDFDINLIILTLGHLLVDGICGAVLARYALQEPFYEPIVYYFSLYTLLAFGLQGVVGYIIDKKTAWGQGAWQLSALLLALGALPQLSIQLQVLLIGVGNCLFHVAGGSYVLRHYKGYGTVGCFVASGALGLGLGLNSLIGAEFFSLSNLLLCLIMLKRIKDFELYTSLTKHPKESLGLKTLGIVVLLFSCIVLRGFGGGSTLDLKNVMLLPCIMALGKLIGGICCDWLGYRQTVLGIFLGGFIALQIEEPLGMILFIFICNMTMPLTLRLAHWCYPLYPGVIFGLAATCLVPGTIFKGFVQLLPQLILVLQFLALVYSGYLLGERES